jgi:hypothetical protein
MRTETGGAAVPRFSEALREHTGDARDADDVVRAAGARASVTTAAEG